jgi:hypothetical protein
MENKCRETYELNKSPRIDNKYKYGKNINKSPMRNPFITTYHHHAQLAQHTHSHTNSMHKTAQDRILFPDAISNGGAIAAITIGSLVTLLSLSLLIWNVINQLRNRSQTTAEEEETIVGFELPPRSSHPITPLVAARYSSQHAVHVQEQSWNWEMQTLA